MEIRKITKLETTQAQNFYKTFNYYWEPSPSDQVFIAKNGSEILGIVRLCTGENGLVLRGMFVKQSYQGKGIGSQMLKVLEKEINDEITYCLPYEHLTDFYGAIGFKTIPTSSAPAFLQERLKKYSKEFRGLIVMKKV